MKRTVGNLKQHVKNQQKVDLTLMVFNHRFAW